MDDEISRAFLIFSYVCEYIYIHPDRPASAEIKVDLSRILTTDHVTSYCSRDWEAVDSSHKSPLPVLATSKGGSLLLPPTTSARLDGRSAWDAFEALSLEGLSGPTVAPANALMQAVPQQTA